MRIVGIFILTVIFSVGFSCSSESPMKETKTKDQIAVQVNSNQQIRVNGELCSLEDFSKIVEKAKEEIGNKEIFVSLTVGDNVKMGIIADIQSSLKELDLRKILYRSGLTNKS